MRVVVSLPTWRCTAYLRRAVDSILAQTHRDLALVVVNDGDPDERFQTLGDVRDPRLVTYALPSNHGPYFAHEVVRRAVDADFFAVQDADDWSAPERLERLLAALDARPGSPGAVSMIGGAYSGKSHDAEYRKLSRGFRHRCCHAGLWRSSALVAIGGYFGGFPIGWDTMIVSALQLMGEHDAPGAEPLAWVPEVLYEVTAREGSLTRSERTGQRSELRERLAVTYKKLWQGMFARRGRLDVLDAIRNRMTRYVTEDHEIALSREAKALRTIVEAGA